MGDVVEGSVKSLTVKMRDNDNELTVPAQDFPHDWAFQQGDAVLVAPSNGATGPLVAKPFIVVNQEPGRSEVFVFNNRTGVRRAAVVTRS